MVKGVIENVRHSASDEFIEKILNPVIHQLIHHNQMVWLKHGMGLLSGIMFMIMLHIRL